MEGKIEELERSLRDSEEREAHLGQEYGGLDAHR